MKYPLQILTFWRNCENNFKKLPPAFFNILNRPLLIQKQMIDQMKALILSFVEPDGQWRGGIKRAQCLLPTKSIGTPGVKIFFKAGGTWQPHVNSTSLFFQPKTAEYKGFLLKYYLFRYKHCFLPNFELKDFPEYTVTPCTLNNTNLNSSFLWNWCNASPD